MAMIVSRRLVHLDQTSPPMAGGQSDEIDAALTVPHHQIKNDAVVRPEGRGDSPFIDAMDISSAVRQWALVG